MKNAGLICPARTQRGAAPDTPLLKPPFNAMKRTFFLLICATLCGILSAQPRMGTLRQTVDSLANAAFDGHETGEDYESALATANRALSLARSARPPYLKGMGDSYVAIGLCQSSLNRFPEAREAYMKALEIRREKLKDRSGEASVYNNLSTLFERQLEYESSIQWAKRAIEIWSNPPDPARLAIVYNNIANACDALGKRDSAIFFNKKSIEYSQKSGDQLELAKAEYGLANRLFRQGNRESEQHARRALRFFEASGAQDELADVYNLLGLIALNENRPDSAEVWLLQALPAYRKAKDTMGLKNVWMNLGEVYSDKNDDRRAGTVYDSAIVCIDRLGDRLSDELAESHLRRIDAWNMQIAAKRQSRIKTIAFALCALLAGVGIAFWFRLKNQELELKNQQLLLQNRDLQLAELKVKNDKMVDALTNQYLIEQKQLRLDAMKAERERIGRDLHDIISNRLNTLRKNLELIDLQHSRAYPKLKAPLENIIGETDVIYKKAYAIYTDLIHHDSDWLLSLKGYCTQIGPASSLEIRFNAVGNLHLIPAEIGNEIERIAMELISNACKHADAGTVSVEIVLDDQRLHILVEDDGKGFNPKDLPRRSGLDILPKRIENLGGVWSIDSAPGRGTAVSVQIPLPSGSAG